MTPEIGPGFAKRYALLSKITMLVALINLLLPKSIFAEDLQSSNTIRPKVFRRSNIERSKDWGMLAQYTFAEDSKPEKLYLYIIIARPLDSPNIFMHDVKIKVFDSQGIEIEFTPAFPDKIPLIGTFHNNTREANAIFTNSITGHISQIPKNVRVTYKGKIHKFEFTE